LDADSGVNNQYIAAVLGLGHGVPDG